MSSLSFPDVNVWLALAAPEHVHTVIARRWWEQETGRIAFSRITQLGFLRLMTTAAAMDGKPLSITAAWQVLDRFFEDDRAAFVPEPAEVEIRFREYASAEQPRQKCGWMHGSRLLLRLPKEPWSPSIGRAHREALVVCSSNDEEKRSRRR